MVFLWQVNFFKVDINNEGIYKAVMDNEVSAVVSTLIPACPLTLLVGNPLCSSVAWYIDIFFILCVEHAAA